MKRLILLACLLSLFTVGGQAEETELAECQQELRRAVQSRNTDSIATAYCHLTEYYAYRDMDSTRYYCLEGLKYADRNKAEPYLVLLVNLAVTYQDEGNMEECLRRYQEILPECVRLGMEAEELAGMLASMGVCFRRMSMPDSALVYYNRALDLLDASRPDETGSRTQLLTNIAVLYANTSRMDEAEAYVRRVMEVVPTCGDLDMVIHAASTSGVILSMRGKDEDGIKAIRQALDMAREQGKPKFILRCLTYLADAYSRMDNRVELMKCVEEAKPLLSVLPENSTEVLGYYEKMCAIYTEIGRYRESLDIQYRLLRLKDINQSVSLDKLYLSMAQNYKGLKDYPQAFDYYERAMDTADSLHQADINAELSELAVKYDTKEKELEIARLNAQQLAQRNRIMLLGIVAVSAVALVVLSVVWYLFRRRRLKKEEEMKLVQRYIEGLERERKRLAKELHDGVCNDLLGIGLQLQCLPSTEQSKEQLKDMLEKVRTDVRFISHELMPPQFQRVTLKDVLEDYVSRILEAQPADWDVETSADGRTWESVPEECSYEVYRILQELLSNVVKHAEAKWIGVRLLLSEHELTLRIVYRGKSVPSDNIPRKGIGLTTVNERARAINAEFKVETLDGEQRMTLTVPLPD